jgi:hypothetical protein
MLLKKDSAKAFITGVKACSRLILIAAHKTQAAVYPFSYIDIIIALLTIAMVIYF